MCFCSQAGKLDSDLRAFLAVAVGKFCRSDISSHGMCPVGAFSGELLAARA